MTAQAGTGWTAGDFALDLLNSSAAGLVTLIGYDQSGTKFTQTESIKPNGQNQYNFTTGAGELVTSIIMPANLLEDLKQVSLNVVPLSTVPLPSGLPLFATGLALMGLLGLRKKRRVLMS